MAENLSLGFQAFDDFFKEFKVETDRAAVIVGAAKVDYLLWQILSKYLLPFTGKVGELLEGDAPISTFSSRIALCYRLGLIDATFARALTLLRRIRNSFAHEVAVRQRSPSSAKKDNEDGSRGLPRTPVATRRGWSCCSS